MDNVKRLSALNLALMLLTLSVLLSLQHILQLERIRLAFGTAILISTIYGGLSSGLIMTALSVAAADFFFLEPIYSFGDYTAVDQWRLIFLAIEGASIAFLTSGSFRLLSSKYLDASADQNSNERFLGFHILFQDFIKELHVSTHVVKNIFIPIFLVGLTALLQFQFGKTLGLDFQRMMFSIPIIASVLWGGFSAGVVATMASAVCADLFFLEPLYSIGNQNLEDRARLLTLMFTGVLMSGLIQVIFDSSLVKLTSIPIRESGKIINNYLSLQKLTEHLRSETKLLKSFIIELSNSQLVDLIAILPLFLIDAFRMFDRSPIAFQCVPYSIQKISNGQSLAYLESIGCLVNLSLIVFSATCFFMLDRTQVLQRETDWRHRALALAGTLMPLSFALLELKEPSHSIDEFAATLLLLGILIATAGFYSLGRSFGIGADVRKLKTKGIYRFVRHPIYLGEILMILALSLMHMTAPAFVILLMTTFLLVIRLRNEERNLAKFHPEYLSYKAKTGMLFPKLF